MGTSVVLCEVCVKTSQGAFVGYSIPGWLVDDIAAGVNQWNVQLKNLGPFLYVCIPVWQCFFPRS